MTFSWWRLNVVVVLEGEPIKTASTVKRFHSSPSNVFDFSKCKMYLKRKSHYVGNVYAFASTSNFFSQACTSPGQMISLPNKRLQHFFLVHQMCSSLQVIKDLNNLSPTLMLTDQLLLWSEDCFLRVNGFGKRTWIKQKKQLM